MLTNAPKGTKDVLPKDSYKWQYVENEFAKICDLYGFGEIRTPAFEHTDLFVRGLEIQLILLIKRCTPLMIWATEALPLNQRGHRLL